MKSVSSLVLLLLFAEFPFCDSAPNVDGPFHVKNGMIVDQLERTRLFHGFNSVIKNPPYYDPQMLNDTRLDQYKKWGFTAVRLGAMWAGAHLGPGSFNATYLGILRQIVDKLAQRGIYTFLDMHQDVLTSYCGSYDGAPKWVIERMPQPEHPYPWPFKEIKAWAEGYVTECTGFYFQGIYDNKAGSRDYLAEFWKKIAETFVGVPGILGYELINEPWAGDVYANPERFLPGVAGKTNLQPLYDHLSDAIRAVDNETLVFFEPVTWGVVFRGESPLGMGFTHSPGYGKWASKTVFSFHYYCWLISDPHEPYPVVERIACDDLLQPSIFQSVARDIDLLGSGSFLTEFGICGPDNNPNSTSTIECDDVMDSADRNLQSWTYWDSNFYSSNGERLDHLVYPFTRPYARAVYGNLTLQKFDLETKAFQLQFTANNNNSSLITEVFVPPVHYPSGVDAHVSDNAVFEYDQQVSMVSIINKAPGLVTFNMQPAATNERK